MTDTEIEGPGRHRNGDVLAESATKRDDVFDETYKEKEGPKPSMIIVWRNIILMTLLHIGAVYGITLVPSAHVLTWAWCKYDKANPLVISNELSFHIVFYGVVNFHLGLGTQHSWIRQSSVLRSASSPASFSLPCW